MSGVVFDGTWPISIHALHEESDLVERVPSALILEFQSTLSMRRATTLFR